MFQEPYWYSQLPYSMIQQLCLFSGPWPHGILNFQRKLIDFDGGYYLTYAYKDGDEKTNKKLYDKALKYIDDSEIFELDVRSNHYAMGHIITPAEIIEVQGWAQMETFIPIQLKDK